MFETSFVVYLFWGGDQKQPCSNKIKHLPVLFTNAFTIMKSWRPFTVFEFLIKLDKAKGAEVGNTYLNRKQGLEFSLAIANLQKRLAKAFKAVLFFNTIFDECLLMCTI